MQTERVTFLTTPDHKAALDAYAANNRKSVGHIVREAVSDYIAQDQRDEDDAKAGVLAEAERAMPAMLEDLEAIRDSIAHARQAIAAALAHEPPRAELAA